MTYPKKVHRLITQFDSTTSHLYALAACLKGKGLRGAGVVPRWAEWVPHAMNFLPTAIRREIYRWSGWAGALTEGQLRELRGDDVSRWVASLYPERRYPAIFIGASNGAVMHLAAALGVPWLPQTFLVSVRRNADPDDIAQDVEWGKKPAAEIRKRNPEFAAYQMHDPVQDRLMVSKMAYFRLKRTVLGPTYERFIRERLEPGGTLVIVDCTYQCPVLQVGDDHTFQLGGLGDLEPDEYLQGSARIAGFLKRQGAAGRDFWQMPGPTRKGLEAEWGFDRRLSDDAQRLAKMNGYRVRTLSFEKPEDAAPFTADLYSRWYAELGFSARRLIAECFALVDPWMCLRTRSVPFWMAFNTSPSARALAGYLDGRPDVTELYIMLLSNGMPGMSQEPLEPWQRVLGRHGIKASFLGFDENKFPYDMASFVRYPDDIAKRAGPLYPPPRPLDLGALDRFIASSSGRPDGRFLIKWSDGIPDRPNLSSLAHP